jgi:hypothetical protein
MSNVKKCACGAITITIEGVDYSMRPVSYKRLFNKTPPRKVDYNSCNHCANHWGVDLCGCGSGKLFGKCKNEMRECRHPMQSMKEARQYIAAGDAWK